MTTTTESTTAYAARAARFTPIVDGVADWDASTPCAGWTARDVLAHVIETQRDFLTRNGLPVAEVDLSDPAAGWRTHLARVEQVLNGEGVPEREYDGYFGRTTIGATMADFYGWDLVIHGWDIASGTGQPWSLSDTESEQMMRTADGWGDALYADGVCGQPVAVPEGASASDRLLARLGRDPDWRG